MMMRMKAPISPCNNSNSRSSSINQHPGSSKGASLAFQASPLGGGGVVVAGFLTSVKYILISIYICISICIFIYYTIYFIILILVLLLLQALKFRSAPAAVGVAEVRRPLKCIRYLGDFTAINPKRQMFLCFPTYIL